MKKPGVMIIEATDLYVRVACIQAGRLCHFDAVLRDGRKSLLADIAIPKKFRSFETVFIIPRREVIFKLLDLPSIDPDELRRMVDVQIASQVPYAKEEIEYSFDVLQTLKSGHSRILVAVIHKEKAQHYLRELQSCGLKVGHMTVSSMAVISACASLKSEIREHDSCYAILNVDEGHCELCLSLGGKVVFSKHFSLGAAAISVAGCSGLVEEIRKVLQAFIQSHPDVCPKGMIIAVPEPLRDPLIDQLREHLGYGVEAIDALGQTAFQGVDLSKWDAHFKSGSAGMLFGAVDSSEASKVNLLPAADLYQKDARRVNAIRSRFFLGFVFAAVFLALILNIHSLRQRMYLAKLQDMYKAIAPDLHEAQESIGVLDLVREGRSRRMDIVLVLKELLDLTPDEVTYRSVQMGRDGVLTLQGESRSGGGVSLLQKNLVASDLFQDEMLRYATKRKRFREEITEFHMTCRMKF